ncbi:MAG: site-specific DNA-methyltransferase [Oligoflexales bacterium]
MTNEYKVKFGDIWKMGKHRLLCGDSTEREMVTEFLENREPKVCVTDPPYGIGYKSKSKKGLYRLKVKYDHIATWGGSFESSQSPVLYVWFSFRHYEVLVRSLQDAGYEVKQMIVWVKHHFTLQHNFYHLKHEQCLVCVKQGIKVTEHWTGDRKQVSVWNIPSVKPKERIHPTEKPVGVYTIPILNHTHDNDYVLDLFAGSGAVFEAAEQLKRVALGIELCPDACDLILKRMAALGCNIKRIGNIFETTTT